MSSPKEFVSAAMQAVYRSIGVDMIAVLSNVAMLNERPHPPSTRTASVERYERDIQALERSVKDWWRCEAELKTELRRRGVQV